MIGADLAKKVDRWTGAAVVRARSRGPQARCVSVLREVLKVGERTERAAWLLSDFVLVRAPNWQTAMLASPHRLKFPRLRSLAVQVSILAPVAYTIRLVQGPARCAALHQSSAPKLRAIGSEAAVALFLAQDAVSPANVLSPMIPNTTVHDTGRTAQCFCNRFGQLDVVHELAGRPNFRLHGMAS